MSIDETPTCQGCGRLNPIPDRVCERCRERAAEQLGSLVTLYPKLPLAQVPGNAPADIKVSTGKGEAPLPVRLDAFSLMSAGTIHESSAFEPGEQVGVLPLRVWLEAWRRNWWHRYDSGRPPAVANPALAVDPNNALMRAIINGGGSQIVTGHRRVPTGMTRTVDDGEGSKAKVPVMRTVPVLSPLADSLDAEYAARFGRPDQTEVRNAVDYLATRLDAACDSHEDIWHFLSGLRAMVGACQSVAGERSDLLYVGRCPERRLDHATGEDELCSGAIWKDASVSMIMCPRCKTETPERGWLKLGARIRAAYPAAAQVHELLAAIVPPLKDKDGNPIRHPSGLNLWSVSCTCGTWDGEQVRGHNIDARGAWKRHVNDASGSERTSA